MKFINKKGFTLVEMLVVVAISGVVGAAILGFFISQQRSHTAQEQVTFMQQNARAALGVMTRELRMAGYNPAGGSFGAFSDPDKNRITLRFDLDESGGVETWDPTADSGAGAMVPDSGETIAYTFDTANFELERAGQALARGIEAAAFAFAYAGGGNTYAIAGADGTGPLDGTVNWYRVDETNGSLSDTSTPAVATDIRAVKIWLLARTENPTQNYTEDRNRYEDLAWPDWNKTGDVKTTVGQNYRYLGLTTVVRCRNMGI